VDPRYESTCLLNRRHDEWNFNSIEETITNLFSHISMIDGWSVKEVLWKPPVKSGRTEELKRHLTRVIRITLEDPRKETHNFDVKIPILVDKQFFYIGGHLKIPIFQLLDDPVLYKDNQSDIRIRTNVISVMMTPDYFKLFREKVPIHELVTAIYTEDEFKHFVIDTIQSLAPKPPKNIEHKVMKLDHTTGRLCVKLSSQRQTEVLESLWSMCMESYGNSTDTERLVQLGSYFSKIHNDEEKKGNHIKFSLTKAANVDIFSKRFFKTNSIVFELLRAYIDGPRSDVNVSNKRIRFSEYILAPLAKKMYDMVMTINNTGKPDYKIPQSILLEECNINQLIHFNNSINPVSELASLFQCSLVGTGAFKKESVPAHLKDLNDSQFGHICSADTPDRDGCGVILNMTPTTKLNLLGKFITDDKSEEVVTSYPISLVPFLQNDDQTRLQMSSNQQKQAILLKESQIPMIKSGIEDNYLEEGSFLYKAEHDGTVVEVNDNLMIVFYDKENEGKVIRTSYRDEGVFDYINPMKKEGVKFNKGDTLCQSKFIKNGSVALGQNLLTGICIWEGLNYEDGIVISESVADTKFTSVHPVDISFEINPSQVLLSLKTDDYRPLPDVGDELTEGEVYAKLKHIDTDEQLEALNIDPFELKAPQNCKIISIEFYVNNWNKSIDDYNTFIKIISNKQSSTFLNTKNKIQKFTGAEECNSFMLVNGLTKLDTNTRVGKYASKGSKIKGIFVNIKAIYEEKISVGDKIANRHGNKGVISKIIPDDEMPILEDGRKLDIIVNPLGIISRMNVGQIYELHMGEAIYQLKEQLSKIRGMRKRITKLKEFLECLNEGKDDFINQSILDRFDPNNLDTLSIVIPPFLGPSPRKLKEIIKLVGSKQCYTLYNPKTKSNLEHDIAAGYVYFMKLVHRASDKTSARSVGPYASKTLQPMGGKSNKGGHRLGEMEVWSMIAHGTDSLLEHMLTTHSDSTKRKNMLLSDILDNPNLINEDEMGDETPQSTKLFEAYLNTIGIGVKSVSEKDLQYND